jgi:hypothetical protein
MAMKPPRKRRPNAAPHMPVWDSQRRLLRIGDRVVFRFAQHARSQEPILAAFQEDRWPAHIDNPLDGDDETDARERLHYAVRRLNAKTRQVIRFVRAMSYHVSWIAPPGKDGVDIVAWSDPLGTRPPRIKVQVKRVQQKVSVEGLRSFMAVLGADDPGYSSALAASPRTRRKRRGPRRHGRSRWSTWRSSLTCGSSITTSWKTPHAGGCLSDPSSSLTLETSPLNNEPPLRATRATSTSGAAKARRMTIL